jgi:hypothetical protein
VVANAAGGEGEWATAWLPPPAPRDPGHPRLSARRARLSVTGGSAAAVDL